jgi:hypothetical protein
VRLRNAGACGRDGLCRMHYERRRREAFSLAGTR